MVTNLGKQSEAIPILETMGCQAYKLWKEHKILPSWREKGERWDLVEFKRNAEHSIKFNFFNS